MKIHWVQYNDNIISDNRKQCLYLFTPEKRWIVTITTMVAQKDPEKGLSGDLPRHPAIG